MNIELLTECERYIKNGGVVSGALFTKLSIPKYKLMDIDTGAAENYLSENRDVTFKEILFAFIDRTEQRDSEVYKKAQIDRRLFSKIRQNKAYIPSKKTVIALCLALELPRNEADRLLSSAGYSLSRADNYDLVIAFCIEKKIFDFFDINEALTHFGFECF